MKESLMAKLLKIFLYAVFVAGVLAVLSMPVMLDLYMILLYDAYSLAEGYRTFILVFTMSVGVLGLWIVGELIATMHTIVIDPFVRRNVRSLRRMGWIGLGVSLLFFLKCLLYVTPLTLLCGLVLLVCSMAAFTLADLFRQAVRFKEENDLTI